LTRRDTQGELPDRTETVRRKILSHLRRGPLSARQISSLIGIPEKEVYAHIPHVKKTAGNLGESLAITPAECNGCSFVFRKRERTTRPGRCPVCRSESISEPLFAVRLK
jgi:predicted Zn-ribbon and HTH transcriptional regulator